MWQFLLDYITEKEETFEFWYELLQKQYFVLFFKDEIAYLELTDESGINFEFCPNELQRVLSDKYSLWTDNPKIYNTIWSESNGMLMIGFNKQNVKLPIEYHKVTKLSLQFFRKILLVNKTKFGDKLKIYWIHFIQNIAQVFFTNSLKIQLPEHEELCKEVLSIYLSFSFDLYDDLDEEVWNVLQFTLLDTTYKLLTQFKPQSIDNISFGMSDALVSHLFLIWLRSPITTDDMWRKFKEKISQLVEWKSVVTQWKEIVIQMTYLLEENIYRPQSEDEVTRVSDTKLASITWTKESIEKNWFIILRILDNPNKIMESENFALAMNCISDIIDILQESEEKHFELEAPLSLYEIFTPWLFEACNVDKKRNRGCLLAYTLLCRFFIKQHKKKIDIRFLTHFYRVIRSGMLRGLSSITWCIMRNTANIFCFNLPGVTVLIPDYLREIEVLFKIDNKTAAPPQQVQSKAISLLNSIICYPSHFKDVDLDTMTMEEVGTQVVALLLMADSFKNISIPHSKSVALCGITTFIFEEIYTRKRPTVLQKGFKALIASSIHQDFDICVISLQCIHSLSVVFSEIVVVDMNLGYSFITGLCENLLELLDPNKKVGPRVFRTDVIASHFNTLLEFLLMEPNVLSKQQYVQKVMDAIEGALNLQAKSFDSQNSANTKEDPESLRKNMTRNSTITNKNPKKTEKKEKGKDKKGVEKEISLSDISLPSEAKSVQNVKDIAESVLRQLLIFYSNFPTPSGPESMICKEYNLPKNADEEMNPDTLHFMYGGNSIFSFRELKDGNSVSKGLQKDKTFVRITLRDNIGKYTWDCQLDINLFKSIDPPKPIKETLGDVKYVPPLSVNTNNHKRKKDDLPKYPNTYQNDSVTEFLNFISEVHPEIISSDSSFCKPYTSSQIPVEEIKQFETNLEYQEAEEEQNLSFEPRTPLTLTQEPEKALSIFHLPRILMGSCGMLGVSWRKRLVRIKNNSKFRRALNDLDKRHVREIVKIGALLVKEGQESQEEILKNDKRTKLYSDFMQGMAWTVNLEDHQGFLGGLSTKNGDKAVYWSNPTVEVIFHDICLMPTNSNDPQQIKKKKHVGNDICTIVWSENKKDYDPSTVTSQFGFVHLIIYPLEDGLFRISVVTKSDSKESSRDERKETISGSGPLIPTKDKIPFFGPVTDGMILNKRLLPILVRQTMINANRVIREGQKIYKRPIDSRDALIKEINDRYQNNTTISGFFCDLFSLDIKPFVDPLSPRNDNKVNTNNFDPKTQTIENK
eukprot:TRINITY_DN2415_c1_g4_i3.p1 TRINITY_DN2415_c1_g4~~TRINITY_DN2415_c1_g4_i3.p1  ORF type:complete len:1262 (+),score=390.11 TRINITY_DN2415_c1_g4_i3:647-4432(+)